MPAFYGERYRRTANLQRCHGALHKARHDQPCRQRRQQVLQRMPRQQAVHREEGVIVQLGRLGQHIDGECRAEIQAVAVAAM